MKRCVVCNKHIRTGRKYCFIHRHTLPIVKKPLGLFEQELNKARSRRDGFFMLGLMMFVMSFPFFIILKSIIAIIPLAIAVLFWRLGYKSNLKAKELHRLFTPQNKF